MSELREKLADQEHERWSRWMKYLFSLCTTNGNGDKVINLQFVERWQRQIDTPYAELSEKEKDSDRKEADNTLTLIEAKHTRQEAVVERAKAVFEHYDKHIVRGGNVHRILEDVQEMAELMHHLEYALGASR